MSQFQRPNAFGNFAFFPPVIKALIIINVAVFFLDFLIQGASSPAFYTEYIKGIFYLIPIDFETHNPQLWHYYGEASFNVWQLFTYQFFHGGFFHILFNLFALWMFGSEIETTMGSRKFLVFYILSGVGAGLIQLVSNFYYDAVPALGASGSVYGVLLAFAMTFPDRKIMMFPFFIPMSAKFFIIIIAVIGFISGFGGSPDGTAHFAHLGGLATGFLLIKFGDRLGIYRFFDKIIEAVSGPPKKPKETGSWQPPKVHKVNWQTKQANSQETTYSHGTSTMNIDGEEITQAKIDEILDKISATGYSNLSEREKKILYELSQKLK